MYVTAFSSNNVWVKLGFPFSPQLQNWKCALFITPATWPLKATSSGFLLKSLTPSPHVYSHKWFADYNSYFTAPLWVSMATTAWESTAACLLTAQTIPCWRHTQLLMFPGWGGMAACPDCCLQAFTSPAWLAWFSVMWRQARRGGPDRINTFLERIFKTMVTLHTIVGYSKWDISLYPIISHSEVSWQLITYQVLTLRWAGFEFYKRTLC